MAPIQYNESRNDDSPKNHRETTNRETKAKLPQKV